MKKITIAFDCDGTLVTTDSAETRKIVANERIRTLLVTLARFKNVRVVIWSGGGEMWARQVGAALGLDKYVWKYMDKIYLGRGDDGKIKFGTDFKPDIAIDDIQACELGAINLIVREK